MENLKKYEVSVQIIVVGVDHTTAPIALRERLACSPRQMPQVLRAAQAVAQECVLLSTCNRLELYAVCSTDNDSEVNLLQVLSETRQVVLSELQAHAYCFTGEQVVT